MKKELENKDEIVEEVKEKVTNTIDEEKLQKLIEETVDKSVKHSFKGYNRKRRIKGFIGGLFTKILIVLVIFGCISWYIDSKNITIKSVDGHDITLTNKGIFGYTVADFSKVILGEAKRKKLLVVEEREAQVTTTISNTGLFNLKVFNKTQNIVYSGTGQYTVDLSEISSDDISLNQDEYTVNIKIPHATLHQVTVDPDKTQVASTQKGWLAFGDIKLNADQTKEIEQGAKKKLSTELSSKENMSKADEFAVLSVTEIYQTLINEFSSMYKVNIEFKE